jgi:hypothetical protein
LVSIAVALTATGLAAGAGDQFTGAWKLDDGDGSTSYYFFSSASGSGPRQFQLFDTYATFCEVGGQAGTGSSLSAHGTAVDDGTTISITVTPVHCANGSAGVDSTPIYLSAAYARGLLDFGGGFLAARVGTH